MAEAVTQPEISIVEKVTEPAAHSHSRPGSPTAASRAPCEGRLCAAAGVSIVEEEHGATLPSLLEAKAPDLAGKAPAPVVMKATIHVPIVARPKAPAESRISEKAAGGPR